MELFLYGVLTCAYFQSRLEMIVFVPKANSEESGFMIAIMYLLFVRHYINHVKPVLRKIVKPAGQNLLMPVLQSYFFPHLHVDCSYSGAYAVAHSIIKAIFSSKICVRIIRHVFGSHHHLPMRWCAGNLLH